MDATLTGRELDWFEERAPAWPWQWATSFNGGAEHAYVIKGRHLEAATYERAARIIHGMGMPRKFYRRLNIELHLPGLDVPYGREPLGARPIQRGVKFWLMSHRASVSKALNIAPMTAEHGRQDAPSTASAPNTTQDLRAFDYDDAFEQAGLADMAAALQGTVRDGRAASRVLDLGARAGAALDFELASRDGGYTAVEPSRGLMHSLLSKHQWVRDIHVMSPEQYLASGESGDLGIVVALFGSASHLRPETLHQLAGRAGRLVLMHHAEDTGQDFFGKTWLPVTASASREVARSLPGARVQRLGDYQLTVV